MYRTVSILIMMSFCLKGAAQVTTMTFSNRIDKKEKSSFYYDLATGFYQKGKFKESINYYDSAINLNLRRTDYYLSRAEAKESAGDQLGALVDYETVIKIDFTDPNPYFKRGLIYHRQKNYKSAIESFSYILENEGFGETKAMIFKGVQENEGGEVKFSGITTMDKMKGDILNARAQSYVQIGEEERALRDFENAMIENPNEPVYFVNRGLFRLGLRDTVLAKQDFITALQKRPGFKPAMFNLAKISSEKERESLNKELYANNDVSVVFSQRAYNKFLKGEYRSALKDYDSALFWMPKSAEDLMNRGIVKAKLKRPRAAIADFDKSIKLDKKLTRNYFLIGNSYQVLKAYKEAIIYYDFYLTAEGPDAQVYYNKGIAELKSGDKKKACQDLTLALKLGEPKAGKAKESACK